mgnify:CR=1 FL=1
MNHIPNRIESDRGMMTDTNSHQPAGTVTGDIAQLPARTVTARKTAVGAQKHFACSFVHGAGAGFVMNTDSLTEKKVAFLLFARPDVGKRRTGLGIGISLIFG